MCCEHKFPWLSHAIRLYRPSLLADLPGYILSPYSVVVDKFLLVVRVKEYITYQFVLTSPAVSRMSCSSNLDSFLDGWLFAVKLLFCGMLPPGFVQYSS